MEFEDTQPASAIGEACGLSGLTGIEAAFRIRPDCPPEMGPSLITIEIVAMNLISTEPIAVAYVLDNYMELGCIGESCLMLTPFEMMDPYTGIVTLDVVQEVPGMEFFIVVDTLEGDPTMPPWEADLLFRVDCCQPLR